MKYNQMYFVAVNCAFSIDLKIAEGSFVGIVGQVGSGKSSLLSAILGETEKLAGDIKVKVFCEELSFSSWFISLLSDFWLNLLSGGSLNTADSWFICVSSGDRCCLAIPLASSVATR